MERFHFSSGCHSWPMASRTPKPPTVSFRSLSFSATSSGLPTIQTLSAMYSAVISLSGMSGSLFSPPRPRTLGSSRRKYWVKSRARTPSMASRRASLDVSAT